MQIEIRSDCVIVKGYINAVERDSRLIPSPKGPFVEQIRSGTWKNAISRKEDIPLLLNHNKKRKLASTKEGTFKLMEDNIGLYGEVRMYDPEAKEKAKNKKFVGWSFGFCEPKQSWGKTDNGTERRYLEDFEITEVSLLDDTRTPAYYGTSIECRNNEEINIEQRSFSDNVEISIDETKTQEDEKRELQLKLLNLELEL